MLKFSLGAIAAAVLIAIGIVLYYPVGAGPRQEPKILGSNDPAPSGFTIQPAPPPGPVALPATPGAPATDAPATAPGDLDAVMARLRATAKTDATTPAAPSTPPAPAAAATPAAPVATTAPAAPGAPPLAAPADAPAAPPATPAPAPAATARWSSVTPGGTRWRMARSGDGYVVTIDLGGGRAADVRVAPAFAGLDPSAIAMRVDYLHRTIVADFGGQASSYVFSRDGSVSISR